ncbi:MAG: copper resistance protein CopC [Microbacterium sp. 69-7]|uniref:copper resistance CopC family protein n=1 Tax=Microbacterium TaxID=33882 RepID=UPI000964E0AA|nr:MULTISPECIES: copper resistance CopC family protein [Microbacterium]MBM7752123.1 methionine-rich copper-binding protein CopC [Microbacterium laevaniformans]OJU45851.1 MAG: copper resistance protein CopC [Microbacterium sp. 69-7]
MSHRVHTFRSVLVGLVALLLGGLSIAVATPAWAHDELIGADPSINADVGALPAQITMTFSGVLMDEPGATQVVVTDAAGASLTDGDPTLDGTHLTQGLAGNASGPVTVTWRVVSSDGHPVAGQYTFTVAGGATQSPSTGETTTTQTLTATPTSSGDAGVPVFVWVLLGLVVAAALGALVAVLLRKSRATPED